MAQDLANNHTGIYNVAFACIFFMIIERAVKQAKYTVTNAIGQRSGLRKLPEAYACPAAEMHTTKPSS